MYVPRFLLPVDVRHFSHTHIAKTADEKDSRHSRGGAQEGGRTALLPRGSRHGVRQAPRSSLGGREGTAQRAGLFRTHAGLRCGPVFLLAPCTLSIHGVCAAA